MDKQIRLLRALLLSASSVFLVACEPPKGGEKADEASSGLVSDATQARPRVRVAKIEVVESRSSSRHLVLLKPNRRSRLSPRYGGQIAELLVREQEKVKEGELLVRLAGKGVKGEVASATASLERAREELEDTRRQLARSRELAAKGIESSREVERLESAEVSLMASIRQAEGQRTQAGDRKSALRVVAPFSGVITSLDTEVGEYVAPGASLMVLAELDRLILEVPLTEEQLRLSDSDGLDFEVRLRDQVVSAPLKWVAQEALPNTATFPARLEIDNSAGKFRAGETAEVRVTAKGTQEQLAVPRTAVRWEGKQPYLLKLESKEKDQASVHRVDIRVRGDQGEQVLVEGLKSTKSEVKDGLTIVKRGPSSLFDGDFVEIVAKEASSKKSGN